MSRGITGIDVVKALSKAGFQDLAENVLNLLRAKDVPGLIESCADVPSPYREALQSLPQLYGGVEVLDRAAAELPALPAITAALEGLRHLVSAADLPFSIDLSDLRGYHYHNGVVFAAYCPDYPVAIALGVGVVVWVTGAYESIRQSVADQVAVEGRRPRGDLEGRAHARPRRNRASERHRVFGGA